VSARRRPCRWDGAAFTTARDQAPGDTCDAPATTRVRASDGALDLEVCGRHAAAFLRAGARLPRVTLTTEPLAATRARKPKDA
jgi:hypothetical protein